MAKDYAKFVPPKPRQSQHKSWRLPLIFALFLVMFCFAALSYVIYAKKTPDAFAGSPRTAAFIEKVASLIMPAKKEAHAATKSPVKTLAKAESEDSPPVQFDFYNELPNMQVNLPMVDDAPAATHPVTVAKNKSGTHVDVHASASTNSNGTKTDQGKEPAQIQAKTQNKDQRQDVAETQDEDQSQDLAEVQDKDRTQDQTPAQAKSIASTEDMPTTEEALARSDDSDESATPTATTKTSITTAHVKKASTTNLTSKASVVSADEISNLLAAENTASQYVVQLGIFETEQGAKRLMSALSDVGFHVNLVKFHKSGHDMYRVQQGPYTNMTQAKATQQRLQKRGVISVIHKTA